MAEFKARMLEFNSDCRATAPENVWIKAKSPKAHNVLICSCIQQVIKKLLVYLKLCKFIHSLVDSWTPHAVKAPQYYFVTAVIWLSMEDVFWPSSLHVFGSNVWWTRGGQVAAAAAAWQPLVQQTHVLDKHKTLRPRCSKSISSGDQWGARVWLLFQIGGNWRVKKWY